MSERLEQDLGVWRTRYSGKRVAMAAASSLQIDGSELAPTMPGPFIWSWHWKTRPGQIVCLARLVAVARGDAQDDGLLAVLHGRSCVARQLGWRKRRLRTRGGLVRAMAVQRLRGRRGPGRRAGVAFRRLPSQQRRQPGRRARLHRARGLTGEDYHGHVFWDTEIYLLPFYTLTWPEAARALLMYRFRTIDGARAKAAGMGWRGAMYAWKFADTGAEATPEQVVGPDGRIVDILCGKQEQHITADVAYAVWQYWQATGDEGFLLDAGAEILLETGRFWSSRAQPEADGYCHIRGVIGPDEYHEQIDDNAFTNVMARWNIRRALDVAACCASAGPSAGQASHAASAWAIRNWRSGGPWRRRWRPA